MNFSQPDTDTIAAKGDRATVNSEPCYITLENVLRHPSLIPMAGGSRCLLKPLPAAQPINTEPMYAFWFNKTVENTHHGTRVSRPTWAALVDDWRVSLCWWSRQSKLKTKNIYLSFISWAGRWFLFTCYDVTDRFDEGSEGGDIRLTVLPHWLPNN